MANPDLIPVPFAQDGDKNPIPLERIISDPSYRATWLEGFPPDTRIPEEVGGEAPDGLDFNGLFNALSQAVVFLQKGNAYQFDAIMAPYPAGALVRSNDNLTTYQSTIAANSNNPNINMTGWRVYNGKDFLVNDLTTGGIDKTLTAEQGKLIKDSFDATLYLNGWQKNISGQIEQWGLASLEPVGNYNAATLGGVTYYTHYYAVSYPLTFVSDVFSVTASLVCSDGIAQTTMQGLSISVNREGFGQKLSRFTVAITSPILGITPLVHWQAVGE